MQLTQFLVTSDIAHNVFFIRGDSFEEEKSNGISSNNSDNSSNYNALRIYVWARAKHVGSRDPAAVAMAVCELGGQIMVFDQEHFDGIEEKEVAEAQSEATHAVHQQVKDKVKELSLIHI